MVTIILLCSDAQRKDHSLNGTEETCESQNSAQNSTPKKCEASGCDNSIDYNDTFEVGFKYCSPECRDKEILAVHHLQLRADIKELEKNLQKLPPLVSQSSYPPPGMSLCGY